MHIAVYGGSFNPLHIGHLAIMKHLVEVAGFDAVYLVVSPKNPLKEREPENDFTLVMGADNLAIIRNWKEYKTILKDFGVAVYPREGHNLAQIKQDLLKEDPAYKIQILEAPLVTVSSTEIREAIKRGEEISHYLM